MDGPVLQSCRGTQYKQIAYKTWLLKSDNEADCFLSLRDSSVIKVCNILENSSGIHIIGQKLQNVEDLYMEPNYPQSPFSSRLGIVKGKGWTNLRSWTIDEFENKVMVIPMEGADLGWSAVFPLLLQANL